MRYSKTFEFSGNKEYIHFANMLVIYTVPGLMLKTNENGELILYADYRVTALTKADFQRKSEIVIADLSKS